MEWTLQVLQDTNKENRNKERETAAAMDREELEEADGK